MRRILYWLGREFLILLGYLWMAPNTLLTVIYVIPLILFGWVNYYGTTKWSVKMRVKTGSWIHEFMVNRWVGWASGVFVFLRSDHLMNSRTIMHEDRHVQQQMVFGVFQPVLYLAFFLSTVAVYAVRRIPLKRAYRDNPLEIDARRYAGQDEKNKPPGPRTEPPTHFNCRCALELEKSLDGVNMSHRKE